MNQTKPNNTYKRTFQPNSLYAPHTGDCTQPRHFMYIISAILTHTQLINPTPTACVSLLTTPFPQHYPAWQAFVITAYQNELMRILCSARSREGELAAMREFLQKLQLGSAQVLGKHKVGTGFHSDIEGIGGETSEESIPTDGHGNARRVHGHRGTRRTPSSSYKTTRLGRDDFTIMGELESTSPAPHQGRRPQPQQSSDRQRHRLGREHRDPREDVAPMLPFGLGVPPSKLHSGPDNFSWRNGFDSLDDDTSSAQVTEPASPGSGYVLLGTPFSSPVRHQGSSTTSL